MFASVRREHSEIPELNASELNRVASLLRGWAPKMLSHFDGARLEGEEATMRGTVETLDAWASAMEYSSRSTALQRYQVDYTRSEFLHSCHDMIIAVQAFEIGEPWLGQLGTAEGKQVEKIPDEKLRKSRREIQREYMYGNLRKDIY